MPKAEWSPPGSQAELCVQIPTFENPIPLAASQDLAPWQRSVRLTWRKWKQRQEVIQKQKNKSPGPRLKTKGKASGITRKYSKARQPDLTVELRGKESVRRIRLGEIRVSDWVCIIYKYLTLGETVPFLQVSCVLLLQKGMQHTRPKSPLSDLEWQQ